MLQSKVGARISRVQMYLSELRLHMANSAIALPPATINQQPTETVQFKLTVMIAAHVRTTFATPTWELATTATMLALVMTAIYALSMILAFGACAGMLFAMNAIYLTNLLTHILYVLCDLCVLCNFSSIDWSYSNNQRCD